MPLGGIDKPLLGQILFFDKNLSLNANQNCASCHNPDHAFVDNRQNKFDGAVSQGSIENRFGKRNAPTMMYAKFSPAFHFDEKSGEYIGGQFWDGRADDLHAQAGQPPLDPNEMAMPSQLETAKRLYTSPMYPPLFVKFYGTEVWDSYEIVFLAMQDALAVFQQEKALMAPFDSKYDLFLQGKATLSEKEEKGRALFFGKANCASCHSSGKQAEKEIFTDFRYYNLGVPSNKALLDNHLGKDFIDNGLLDNPLVSDEKYKGKFKTPTLRNVAVTEPYMHNGAFKELRTVLHYLDSFNNPARKLNPETGKEWDKAEYAPTISHNKLKAAALSDDEIVALEAFLKTLTDERYISLLK